MSEFSIIERFCTNLGANHKETRLPVGDDAAVIAVPPGMEMAISADTMVEGVHFFHDTCPALLAHKIVAVNLSDMAAMGAEPKWATLALTLPNINEQWLETFSTALNAMSARHGVEIIGGDTTQGPLNLCVNIMGLLPEGKALTRSGAGVGDDLYVSNVIGDAALALSCINGDVPARNINLERLRKALDTPVPQVALGCELLNIATACLDISDGLIADLGHIAKQSQVSFEVDIDQIPLSLEYQNYILEGGSVDLALTGGDDYQLAFTASHDRRVAVQELSQKLNIAITKIGKVVSENNSEVALFSGGKSAVVNKQSGYEHFNG